MRDLGRRPAVDDVALERGPVDGRELRANLLRQRGGDVTVVLRVPAFGEVAVGLLQAAEELVESVAPEADLAAQPLPPEVFQAKDQDRPQPAAKSTLAARMTELRQLGHDDRQHVL